MCEPRSRPRWSPWLAVLLSWAVVGFSGFTSYPELLGHLTDIEGANSHGVSIYQVAIATGLPGGIGHAVSFLVGGALLAGSFVFARRHDDRAAFTLAIVAVLAFTPLVWLHYLTLLVIPLAAYRPQFSGAWAVPWLMWGIALPGWPFEPRPLLAFVVVVILVARLLTTSSSPPFGEASSLRRRRAVPEPGR